VSRRRTFRQLEQGVLRSHLILRCWHKTQASTLGWRGTAWGALLVEDIMSEESG
jgi:hypothetical protein